MIIVIEMSMAVAMEMSAMIHRTCANRITRHGRTPLTRLHYVRAPRALTTLALHEVRARGLSELRVPLIIIVTIRQSIIFIIVMGIT